MGDGIIAEDVHRVKIYSVHTVGIIDVEVKIDSDRRLVIRPRANINGGNVGVAVGPIVPENVVVGYKSIIGAINMEIAVVTGPLPLDIIPEAYLQIIRETAINVRLIEAVNQRHLVRSLDTPGVRSVGTVG